MTKESYSDKLKNVNWQKKRLKIMERDGFKCNGCFNSNDKMLSVHHLYYLKGHEPWEYNDDALITLCEKCHTEYHDLMPICISDLTLVLKQRKLFPHDIRLLTQSILNCKNFDEFIDLIRPSLSDNDIYTHTHPQLQELNGLIK